jgi:hypothetical protein
MPNDAKNQLECGKVILTKAGSELARICEGKRVDGFFEYMKDKWKQYLVAPEGSVEIKVTTP